MKEKISLLKNMSSASRSSVNVRPRHVEQPVVIAQGAQVASDVGVLISMYQVLSKDVDWHWFMTKEEQFLEKLSEVLLPKSKKLTSEKQEEQLRLVANNVVGKYGLVGCAIVQPKKDTVKTKTLKNPELVFAILSKSSDQIFVASKTPNLSREVLGRNLVTFDPRIIALLEEK